VLLGIVALGWSGAWDQVPDLRRDVVGAALQVFNWVRLAGTGSYADLLAADGGQPSPVEHFWSLAIEEQVYWIWPVAFAVAARRARNRGRSLLAPIVALTAVAVALGPAIARTWGPDAAYWATPARVGEVLTGAVVAVVVAERAVPSWLRHLALPALGAIAIAVATFPPSDGPAYGGWLPALSIVTALAIAGLQHEGPARRLLSVRPLVAIGAISYGIYLVHWPVIVLLDEGRVGHDGPLLLAVRLGATLALALASAVLIERPVRRARPPARPTLVAAGAVTVVVALVALTLPRPASVGPDASAVAASAFDPVVPSEPLTVAPGPDEAAPDAPTRPDRQAALADDEWRVDEATAPPPSRPVRILLFGDSTADATGAGLARWAADHPELAQVAIVSADGCGFAQGGVRVFDQGEVEIGPACDAHVDDVLPARVRELGPDLVVFLPGGWDITDQRFDGEEGDGGGQRQAPTDPGYRRRIERGFAEATADALDAGAPRILWLAEPTTNPFWNEAPSPQEDPARHAVLHGAMRRVAADDPDRVAVADLAWWLDASGLAAEREARPDGVHLSPDAADALAARWLGPVAVSAALRGR
jgi:peptidoglycan/LPS O-acetylase OafA/YrhL/lysophospholipase L1-like esterase